MFKYYIVDASCRMHEGFHVFMLHTCATAFSPDARAHRAPLEHSKATGGTTAWMRLGEKQQRDTQLQLSAWSLGDLVWVRELLCGPLLPDRYI